MNVGEGKTVNVCQENNSKNVEKNQSLEESATPRRSTRIRKSKKVIKACSKEVGKCNEESPNFEILNNPLVKPANSSDAESENSSVQHVNKDFELSNTLFQGDNSQEESFESMFDDILENTYSKTLQKSSNDLLKERKFFKTQESSNLRYVYNKSNLPTEDVNKVFKIISKPNALSNITPDSKSPIKPLKTYSNKRKTFQKLDVVESFGLPDHPITPENAHLNKELDVALEDGNERTVLDMEFVSEPWIIAAEGEDVVPIFEEIRTKSDPIYYPFMKNGSFFDFDFESFVDPTILTAPYNSQISSKDGSTTDDTGINIVQKNKEIDIEAIKINFKKILCKNDLPEQEEVKLEKNRLLTSKKKRQVSKNICSVNSDISFVEDDSLTVDNEEFEFSNDLIVPKTSNLDQSKNTSKRNSWSNNKEINTTKKKLRSSINSEEGEETDLKKAKTVLKTTPRKQKLMSETEIKESADKNLPKKISETDTLISNSKCNLQPRNVGGKNSVTDNKAKTVKENNQGTVNDRNFNKRILRSNDQASTGINNCSLQNNPDNSTNEIRKENINKTLDNSAIKDYKLFEDMADSETLKKSTNVSSSQTQAEKNKTPLKQRARETKHNGNNKRTLRSTSQDLLEQVNPSNKTNTFNQHKNNIICTTDMRVSLQKCDFKRDFDSFITDTTCDGLSRENFQTDKIVDKLSPLKKDRKAIPEIIVILKQLDISKLDQKFLEKSKHLCSDMLPTTKKNIRSSKAVLHPGKTNQSESYNNAPNINNKCHTNCKESASVHEESNKIESVKDLVEKNKLSQCETNMVQTTHDTDSCKIAFDVKVKNSVINEKEGKLKDSNNTIPKSKKVQNVTSVKDLVEKNKLSQCETNMVQTTNDTDSCKIAFDVKVKNSVIHEKEGKLKDSNNTIPKSKKVQNVTSVKDLVEKNKLSQCETNMVQTTNDTDSCKIAFDVKVTNSVINEKVGKLKDSNNTIPKSKKVQNLKSVDSLKKDITYSLPTKIKNNELFRRENTLDGKDVQNLSLAANKNLHTENVQVNTDQVMEEHISSEIKPCNIHLNNIDSTRNLKSSEVTHVDSSTTICENNKELVGTKPKPLKKKENDNGNIAKSNLKEQGVSNKLCASISLPLLNSENKNKVKHDTKLDEQTSPDLWEKKEDKPVDSSLYQHKPTKILDESIDTLSKNNMLHEIENLKKPPECNNLISDENKIDSVKESKTDSNNSSDKTLKVKDDILNYNEIQEITDIKTQQQELEDATTTVQSNSTLSQQCTINAGEMFEKQQSDRRQVFSEKQTSNKDLTLPIESNISAQTSFEVNLNTRLETTEKEIKPNSNIESTVTSIKNKDEDKEVIDKHSGYGARLKEKRNKLLEITVSAEEGLKKHEQLDTNKLISPGDNVEKIAAKCLDDISIEQPVTIRKRGRPRTRRPDIDENLPASQIQRRPRGRPKKTSLDDMDLVNRYKGYYNDKIQRIQRSKSVTRSMLEIERKPNLLNRWKPTRDFIFYHTRSRDFNEDDTDLLSRIKKCKPENKSKIEGTSIPKINSSNENLASKSNTKEVPEPSIKQNTYMKKSQLIGTVPDVEDVAGNKGFSVGDITWAQIGSHPFWPCLIMKEPGTGYYTKIFQGKRFTRELYHVRFFGDNGRRAWINKQQILLYSEREDLKNLQTKLRAENKPIPAGYIVKSKTFQKWECAVKEAEQLKMKNIKEKLLFFSDIKNLSKPKESATKDLPKDTVTSMKRKLSEDNEAEEKCLEPSPAEESEPEKTQTQKKFKRNVSDEHKVLIEDDVPQRDGFENEHNVDCIEESNQPPENILSRMLLKRQIDENSEVSSKTSSDNVTDTSLNSMELQKALYKRNNLFRGVSRDKVCQYCFKTGDVLKCRGRCNGSFHVSCSLKILQEESPKKKRGRHSKIKQLDDIKNEENTSISSTGENPDCLNLDMKVGMCSYKGEDDSAGLTEEDQVQIITVPSSVYNTPPRKTFPPDFKNMTLAEQIDYKMKEIMKKFETKTFYSESSSESSSEERLGKQVALIYPNNTTCIGVRMNDIDLKLTTPETIKSDIGKAPNTMERLIVGKKIEKKLTPVVKKKLFIRHVTADSENMKVDFPQDEKLSTDDESFESIKTLDPKNFKCGFCMADMYPYCFICHLAVSKKGSSIRQKCSIYQCGRFYHPDCLKMWPQTQWSLIQTTRHKDSDKDMDSFVCPLHVCHTCSSDDPRAATSRCSGDKIVKCLRCPSTYHSSNLCVPSGTAILSSSQIVCPRHREKSKLYTINTTWCFLCSAGGNLICCETCPTSVHPECLPVNLTDDDKFICEDCESGRLPLYDEIVWVKLGKFRWWPALILFPNEVPDNIRKMKHSIGEFVVKFFGTYDYYWVNRGRSFLFQEGDTGQCSTVKKKVDAAFNRAVEEAVVAHKLKKEFKLSQEVESITSLKPPPYIRIKVNKPVGNVRHLDLDLSSTNACECDPNKPHPCGPESDCLNRLLLTECNPEVCPAGKRCKNQSFEKREYPPLVPYKTQGRGWGLKTLAPIKKGQFVVEYVGELIDSEEYQRRIQKMHEQKEENYYFLTIDKDRMIDAGPKGNVARFMNHCCQPNCETQKWTVNGDTRVGLFATEDIAVDTELTFNYNLECVGKEKKVCRCGAPNCSGFIGVKAKHDTDTKKPKKSVKRKVPVEPVVLPPCFICGKMDNVISCNNKICNKTYHQDCLKTSEPVEGNKFICPWHNCNICAKRTIRCCVKCINSYCPSHSDGNIKYDNLLGFVCTNHDPMTSPDDVQVVKHKRKKSDVVTEESAVSSTTSDDAEDDEDWTPLLTKLKRINEKQSTLIESESDNDSNVTKSLKKISQCSDQESQDEGAISSATVSDVGEEVALKRKRRRPKRKDQLEKKIRLNSVQRIGITASSSPIDDKLRDHSSSELTSRHNELENR